MSDTANTTKLTDLAPETRFKVVMLTGKGLFFVAQIGKETAEYLRQNHLSTLYVMGTAKPELPTENQWLAADKNWMRDQHPLYLFSSLQLFEVDGQYILLTASPECPYNAMTLSKINIFLPVLERFVLGRFAELSWDRFLAWVRNYTGLTEGEAMSMVEAATAPEVA